MRVRAAVMSVVLAVGCLTSSATAGTRQTDPAFSPIMSQLTSATSVPILLPASMPTLYAQAGTLFASIVTNLTNASFYEVSLGSSAACAGSHFCNVAEFVGEVSSNDSTPLGTTKVSLANAVQGYFTPGRCGSSSGNSRLDWISGTYRYVAFVRYEPQPVNSLALANSMITGVASTATASGSLAIGFSALSYGAIFYPTYGQEDLGSGENFPASLRKYIRIDTVLSSNANAAEWVECGDVNGYVGTSSQHQRWSGHFYAWHTTTGSFGEMIVGAAAPTGQVMLYCARNGSTGWDFGEDYSAIATITAVSGTANGARVGAYLEDTNSGAIEFTNGTSQQGLSNINDSGYVSWPTSTAVFLKTYPDSAASAVFSQSAASVTFTHPSTQPFVARKSLGRRMVSVLPQPRRTASPTHHDVLLELQNERELSGFAGLAALSKRDGLSVSKTPLSQSTLSSHTAFFDIGAQAEVWDVAVLSHEAVTGHFGTLAAGSKIHYYYEVRTGRLLGFIGQGQLVSR